ncbi:MAG: UDP-N-acetylmuramate dehydrogenase [Alphaproteobacteria bacterium]|nr:UDP-N-acetylmuramate dehydrogenase [Alphaproteobacteria bacterium]
MVKYISNFFKFDKKEFYPLENIISFNVPLAPKTTFKIGGNAAVFTEPNSVSQLCQLIAIIHKNSWPFFILGGGSNVVINDNGLNAVVVGLKKLKNICLLQEPVNKDEVFVCCDAGVTIGQLVSFCINNSVSGVEEFAGLPGTCGGACYMNARCYGVSFSENLNGVFYIGSDYQEHKYIFNAKDWDYKKSPFQQMIKNRECFAITKVILRLRRGNKNMIDLMCAKYIKDRENKGHFNFPSAGSVFKNNHNFGKPSGQIIDEVGLRGIKIGDAQIAPWHGNFIINTGNASAKDVKQLIQKIKSKVFDKTGFELEPEIIFVD